MTYRIIIQYKYFYESITAADYRGTVVRELRRDLYTFTCLGPSLSPTSFQLQLFLVVTILDACQHISVTKPTTNPTYNAKDTTSDFLLTLSTKVVQDTDGGEEGKLCEEKEDVTTAGPVNMQQEIGGGVSKTARGGARTWVKVKAS